MDKQGPEEDVGDVTLKCRDAVYNCSKNNLSAQSEYFKTLFQGNFSDSNATEIDLSSVFEDEKSFRNVIEFFTAGVVDLSDIFLLARYASFFQAKALKELCEAEMKKRVNLQNCITYYIFAKSADYITTQRMTSDVITKRFHDYFLYKDDIVKLYPSDLQGLLSVDCLKHCSTSDILKFIAKWVLFDITPKRIEVGQNMLYYLKERTSNIDTIIGEPIKPCVETYRCQLEAKLNDSPEVDDDAKHSFIQTFQRIIELVPKSDGTTSEETALFTLSKRKKLDLSLFEETGSKTPKQHFSTGTDKKKTIFDVCVYRPRKKQWYYVETIENKPNCADDEDIYPFNKASCKIDYIQGHLLFSSKFVDKILTYNCEEKVWNSLDDPNVSIKHTRKCRKLVELENVGTHVFVWNGTIFVIKVKLEVGGDVKDLIKLFKDRTDSTRNDSVDTRSDSDDSDDESDELEEWPDELASVTVRDIYFEIFKMDKLSGHLSLILSTTCEHDYFGERFLSDLSVYETLLRSSVVARASKSMDEIMVVCFLTSDTDRFAPLPEMCVSFVTNIEDESVHYFHEETCEELFYESGALFLLDDTDGFLVAVNANTGLDTCYVIGSYKYLSKELKLKEGLQEPPYNRNVDDIPTTSGTNSLWFFNGSFLYHNDCHNVTFHNTDDGEYETRITEQTPHPFTTLIASVETKVASDIFKQLKPSSFLG